MTKRSDKSYREFRAEHRGSCDRFYGRSPRPHIWLDGIGCDEVLEPDMSAVEVQRYWHGYENEEDRKDW